mgnify:CR=1 FL=1|tara:strand:- start:1440 stop:2156 length:717 start_codon:yes stop_codon:yes gene_type:complete
MKTFILYQNNNELNRFNKYLPPDIKILFGEIIYFKSHIYKNTQYDYKQIDINYFNIYKNIYKNKLNQNQLNHLLSIKKIIELASHKNYESIMILEYDVYFNKNFIELYDEYKTLIVNNDIIHLGSSQHNWFDIITNEKINIKTWKTIKYYNNSHSLGTFAIILKNNIFVEYLNFINYVLTSFQYFPSDVILSIISRKYKSVVLYPNLIICDLDNSNIIKKDRSKDYIKFKWYKNKYIC